MWYVIFIYLTYLYLCQNLDYGNVRYEFVFLVLLFPSLLATTKKVVFPHFLCFACLPYLLLKYQIKKLRNFEQFFYNKPAYLQNSVAECWKPNDTLVFHYVFLSNRCSSPCWWKDASYGHVFIKEKYINNFQNFTPFTTMILTLRAYYITTVGFLSSRWNTTASSFKVI